MKVSKYIITLLLILILTTSGFLLHPQTSKGFAIIAEAINSLSHIGSEEDISQAFTTFDNLSQTIGQEQLGDALNHFQQFAGLVEAENLDSLINSITEANNIFGDDFTRAIDQYQGLTNWLEVDDINSVSQAFGQTADIFGADNLSGAAGVFENVAGWSGTSDINDVTTNFGASVDAFGLDNLSGAAEAFQDIASIAGTNNVADALQAYQAGDMNLLQNIVGTDNFDFALSTFDDISSWANVNDFASGFEAFTNTANLVGLDNFGDTIGQFQGLTAWADVSDFASGFEAFTNTTNILGGFEGLEGLGDLGNVVGQFEGLTAWADVSDFSSGLDAFSGTLDLFGGDMSAFESLSGFTQAVGSGDIGGVLEGLSGTTDLIGLDGLTETFTGFSGLTDTLGIGNISGAMDGFLSSGGFLGQAVPVEEIGQNLTANLQTAEHTESIRQHIEEHLPPIDQHIEDLHEKAFELDPEQWRESRDQLREMNQEVFDEVTEGGPDGGPKFMENYAVYRTEFMRGAAQAAAEKVLDEVHEDLRETVEGRLSAAQGSYNLPASSIPNPSPQLYGEGSFTSGDESSFSDHGGWDSWFSITQNPQNNPIGAGILAEERYQDDIYTAADLDQQELAWNEGYHSDRDEDGNVTNPGRNIAAETDDATRSARRQVEQSDQHDFTVDEYIRDTPGRIQREGLTGGTAQPGQDDTVTPPDDDVFDDDPVTDLLGLFGDLLPDMTAEEEDAMMENFWQQLMELIEKILDEIETEDYYTFDTTSEDRQYTLSSQNLLEGPPADDELPEDWTDLNLISLTAVVTEGDIAFEGDTELFARLPDEQTEAALQIWWQDQNGSWFDLLSDRPEVELPTEAEPLELQLYALAESDEVTTLNPTIVIGEAGDEFALDDLYVQLELTVNP